jgi:hypothetical protein
MGRKLKLSIVIGFSFMIFFAVLGVLRDIYGERPEVEKKEAVDPQQQLSPVPSHWKYHAGDNSEWAKENFEDRDWKIVDPALELDSIPEGFFNGICWFRTKFSVKPDQVNTVLGWNIDHHGASEVYLDGKLVGGFGKVSNDPMQEKGCSPDGPILFSVGDTNSHCFSVRYSNHKAFSFFKKYSESHAGITSRFVPYPFALYEETDYKERQWFTFTLLFGFFITLSIVHFLLYLFYRKQKQNLYYSIFVFFFSCMILTPYLMENVKDPEMALRIQFYYIIPTILVMPSMVACLHSLFKPKLGRRMLVINILLGFAIWISGYFENLQEFTGMFLFSFILFSVIESVRTVVIGVIQKQPGAKIIGTGVLIFCLVIMGFLITAFIRDNFHLSINTDSSTAFIALIILWIISIPLSMSVYLAREFAITNKNLATKLNEVEELSAKTIAQEKEKQHILASQNETLEAQVKERTQEIQQQKHLIEEKNKEVMDSIRYAKRIQTALITSDKYISKVILRLNGPEKKAN